MTTHAANEIHRYVSNSRKRIYINPPIVISGPGVVNGHGTRFVVDLNYKTGILIPPGSRRRHRAIDNARTCFNVTDINSNACSYLVEGDGTILVGLFAVIPG